MRQYIVLVLLAPLCSIFFLSKTYAQEDTLPTKWDKLQLDLNFLSAGIKTTYHLLPKLQTELGIGIGIATVSEHNMAIYEKERSEYGTCIAAPIPFAAAFYQAGIQYDFANNRNPNKYLSDTRVYLRGQFRHYFPSGLFFFPRNSDNKVMHHNYRSSLFIGTRGRLKASSRWHFGLEAGATLWNNFNFSHSSLAPAVNINWTYSIL